VNTLILKLAMVVTVGSLLYSNLAGAQESATTTKAARVRITQGPEIERVDPDFAIIRWTGNNPGGSPEHYGIVRYGTDPTKLNQTAKSPIRLNPGHSYTVFRVRLDGLKPRTTYYYTVDSTEANGKADGVKSAVRHFTTP
jgi:phosphodiesterase/alkaline phosphatase D-like protein